MKIFLSGASNSGKTNFGKKLISLLKDDVIFYDEVIKKVDLDINKIRKNNIKYFQFEKKIISEKIKQELKHSNKIQIYDRSIFDSLYYLMFFVNKIGIEDEYYKFLNYVFEYSKNYLKNDYLILLFKPLENIEQTKYRDINLKKYQQIEYEIIKRLIKGNIIYMNNREINDIFKKNFKFNNINYKQYKQYLDIFYEFQNVLMNNNVVLPYKNEKIDDMLMSCMLYEYNLKQIKWIIDDIKSIQIEKEYMDSRAYPIGLAKKHNIMIIGEAPGEKGRGIKNDYLKPTFTFTKTSYYLKKMIFNLFKQMPYITNLLKFAMPKNKVSLKDFDNNFDILLKEIELIQPSIIISLGNNVYNYLKQKNINSIKVYHPAYLFYSNMNINEYIKDVEYKIKGSFK